jgi:hypothetical protein
MKYDMLWYGCWLALHSSLISNCCKRNNLQPSFVNHQWSPFHENGSLLSASQVALPIVTCAQRQSRWETYIQYRCDHGAWRMEPCIDTILGGWHFLWLNMTWNRCMRPLAAWCFEVVQQLLSLLGPIIIHGPGCHFKNSLHPRRGSNPRPHDVMHN